MLQKYNCLESMLTCKPENSLFFLVPENWAAEKVLTLQNMSLWYQLYLMALPQDLCIFVLVCILSLLWTLKHTHSLWFAFAL